MCVHQGGGRWWQAPKGEHMRASALPAFGLMCTSLNLSKQGAGARMIW